MTTITLLNKRLELTQSGFDFAVDFRDEICNLDTLIVL